MKTQKRLAASLMKCGVNKVRVNPDDEEIQMALTREDIRAAISRGAIYKLGSNQQSRGNARIKAAAKKKGRSSGHGKRKGAAGARSSKKQQWAKQIRAVRRELRIMRDAEIITPNRYRKLYSQSKAGLISNRAHARRMGEE